MRQLKQCYRLFHIYFVLAKHGVDEIISATGWFGPLTLVAYLNPYNWYRNKSKCRGQRIREALEELGPIFIKFGQMLSVRPDILPEDIINELSLLQDNVKPFPQAEKILAKIYGKDVTDIFSSFDKTPLASASIAQVHAAQLTNGQNVIVKVLRPNIEKKIKRDTSLLLTLAKITEYFWSFGKRLKPVEIINVFERTLLHEVDLMREAANASQLHRNFNNSKIIYIPKVYWPYCRNKAIVFERICGIPVSDIDTLRQHNINLQKLAENGVEIFFTQVFRDCFFHADMHPGNIFINPEATDNPQYIAVDFGIMGTLNPTDQRYLAENLMAFFQRDYRRIALLHVDSGWVPADTCLDDFEAAIRTVCEPIFEQPLKDISCGQLLLLLFKTGKQFHMEIQPQLLLLQKTLIHIEGLGRQLYPDLDLWKTAKPFLENWLQKKVSIKSLASNIFQRLPQWLETAPEIPELIYNALQPSRACKSRTYHTTKTPKQKKLPGFAFGFATSLILISLFSFAIAGKSRHASVDLIQAGFLLETLGVFLLLIVFFTSMRK